MIEGHLDPQSVRRVHARLSGVKTGLTKGLRGSFVRNGDKWEKGVQSRFGGDSTGPRNLRNRSRRLYGGIGHKVTGAALGDLKLEMFVKGVPYARKQEFGGEIKPKNAKFLTIPTVFNQQPSGLARFPSARSLIAAHPKETFFQRGKRGGIFLFWTDPTVKAIRSSTRKVSDRRAGGVEKGAAVPMFSLVKKVDIPGPFSPSKRGPSRLGVHDTWREQIPTLRADFQKLASNIASGTASALGGA